MAESLSLTSINGILRIAETWPNVSYALTIYRYFSQVAGCCQVCHVTQPLQTDCVSIFPVIYIFTSFAFRSNFEHKNLARVKAASGLQVLQHTVAYQFDATSLRYINRIVLFQARQYRLLQLKADPFRWVLLLDWTIFITDQSSLRIQVWIS